MPFTFIALTLLFSSNLYFLGEFLLLLLFYGMLVKEDKTSNQFMDSPCYDAELKVDCCLTAVQFQVGQQWPWSSTCGYLLGMEGTVILWELTDGLRIFESLKEVWLNYCKKKKKKRETWESHGVLVFCGCAIRLRKLWLNKCITYFLEVRWGGYDWFEMKILAGLPSILEA